MRGFKSGNRIAMDILYYLLSAVFLIVCLLMIMIVLLQPSQGEGLGSAFGGGISESFFGTRAMTWLARATIVLVLVYLGIAIGLNKIPRGESTKSGGSVMDHVEPPSLPAGETAAPAAPAPDAPAGTPEKAPADAPDKPPADAPTEAPAEAPAKAPAEPAGKTPAPSTPEPKPESP
jgi:preprotein translocase subunit SecG